MPQLAVANAGRLVHARTGLKAHHALTPVSELDPTLQDVDELELGLVQVRLAGKVFTCGGANDMDIHPTLGGALDTAVAIFVKRAQAALELGVFEVCSDETLGGYGLALFVRLIFWREYHPDWDRRHPVVKRQPG